MGRPNGQMVGNDGGEVLVECDGGEELTKPREILAPGTPFVLTNYILRWLFGIIRGPWGPSQEREGGSEGAPPSPNTSPNHARRGPKTEPVSL